MAKTKPRTLQEEILRLIPDPFTTKKALATAAGITEPTLYNILKTGMARTETLAKLKGIGVQGIGSAVGT